MVSHLHLKTHTRKGIHELCADAYRLIIGGEIEIAAHIVRYRVNGLLSVPAEEKELGFRPHIVQPAA